MLQLFLVFSLLNRPILATFGEIDHFPPSEVLSELPDSIHEYRGGLVLGRHEHVDVMLTSERPKMEEV